MFVCHQVVVRFILGRFGSLCTCGRKIIWQILRQKRRWGNCALLIFRVYSNFGIATRAFSKGCLQCGRDRLTPPVAWIAYRKCWSMRYTDRHVFLKLTVRSSTTSSWTLWRLALSFCISAKTNEKKRITSSCGIAQWVAVECTIVASQEFGNSARSWVLWELLFDIGLVQFLLLQYLITWFQFGAP